MWDLKVVTDIIARVIPNSQFLTLLKGEAIHPSYHSNPCNLGNGADFEVTRNNLGITPLL